MSANAWVRLQRRYCWTLLKLLFFTADTSTVRLGLAGASSLFAAFLAFHTVFGTGLFERPAYALMAQVGPAWFWIICFALHGAFSGWRLVDAVQRDRLGFVVNGFGFLIWTYSTLCINFALGQLLPSTAAEWMMIIGSGWAFYRTGWNERVTS